MSDDVFSRLAERLDQIPNGFTPTESGSHLSLLKLLYSPEEAELAAVMRLTGESAEAIASRIGMDPKVAYRSLKRMTRKGLIHAGRGEGGLAFWLIPFAIGVYEEQIGRMDAAMAEAFEAYYQEVRGGALTGTSPSLTRVIPVGETLTLGVEVFPHERASEIVESAKSWGLLPCICRMQQKLVGKGCAHTVENCMIFAPVENAFGHNDLVRAVSKEEAMAVLQQAEQEGLVHTTGNYRDYTTGSYRDGRSFICNCCTCSCGVLRGVSEFAIPTAVAHSDFVSAVDEDLCILCGECAERCQFDAIAADVSWELDRKRCVGCGQCVLACPVEALRMERRPDDETAAPPANHDEWLRIRAKARGLALEDIL